MHRLLRLGGDPPTVLRVLGQLRAAKQNLGDKMKGNDIVQLEEENAKCFFHASLGVHNADDTNVCFISVKGRRRVYGFKCSMKYLG